MALFGSGPRSNILQTVAPMYQGIIDAEKQKGVAMREAMGAFGKAIDPKTIAMRKFRQQFGNLTEEQRRDPNVLRSMAATIVTEDPQAASGLLQMANALTPSAPAPTELMKNAAALFPNDPVKQKQWMMQQTAKEPSGFVSQASGAQLNEALGVDNFPEDAMFNVSPKGSISRIGTGTEKDTIQVGSIPQGYELIKDEESGALSMRPIAGGPVEAEEEAAKKREEIIQTSKEVASDVVNADLDMLESIVSEEGVMAPVTGVTGWVASFIPGTVRADAEALAATIKANVGFDKLQSMRDASPTGGALGQVSEQENKYLQSTLGNLEFSQSKEQLLRNIDKVRRAYNKVVHGFYEPPHLRKEGGDVLGILE